MDNFKPISYLRAVEKFLNNVVAGCLLVGMMLMIVTDVISRSFFNRPINGVIELTEFIMVVMIYFSIAHSQALKAHISVEVLMASLSSRSQHILKLLTYALGVFVFGMITWQGVLSAVDAYQIQETTSGVVAIPTLPAKIALPVGCAVLCLRYLADMIETIPNIRRRRSSS